MALHVDLGHGDGDRALKGFEHGGGLAGQRQNAAVVAGVARSVEEVGARHPLDGRGQLVDDLDPTSLAEVRDRLYELRNATSVSPWRQPPDDLPA
jgi:hypothetical protein